MPTAADIKLTDQFRGIIYGRFKTGKTEGAATFPRPNFISFDQGMNTLASKGFRERHPNVDLKKIYYQDFFETNVAKNGIIQQHNAFDAACQYFDACMASKPFRNPMTGETSTVGKDDFDTWVLDSGTTLSGVAMNKAVVLLQSMNLSKTFSTAQSQGLLVPKQQDFGAERSLVEQFVRMLYTSGKHFVLICHEKEITTESGAVTDIVPLLTGQSVERVCLMFDEVYRLQAVKQGSDMKRVIQTKTNGIIKCGTRLGVPDGIPWDWSAIQSALRASN